MANSVHDDDKCPQFSHALYVDCEPISDVYNIIKPIFATLNPIGIPELSSMQHQELQRYKRNHYTMM